MADSDEKQVLDNNGVSQHAKQEATLDPDNVEDGSSISETRLIRKLDYTLLPPLTLLYLLSFLDRSNGKKFCLKFVRAGRLTASSRECSHRRSRQRFEDHG